MDSSEEDADLSDDEPPLIRRAPRKKNPMPVLPQHQMPPRPPAMQTASEPCGQPNWSHGGLTPWGCCISRAAKGYFLGGYFDGLD